MFPWIILFLVVAGIAGSFVASACAGHRIGRELASRPSSNRVGRFLRDYRLWSILAALFMCGSIMVPLMVPQGLLLSIAGVCLMVVCLMTADCLESRTPKRETCRACGH